MRLEHANLVVKDIQPTLDFLLAASPQWRVRGEGESTWGSGQLTTSRRWIHVGDDDYYITLNDGAEGEMRDVSGIEPGVAHLGFVVDDVQAVTERLANNGFTVDITSRNHPFRKAVYYNDPAGFQFEFIEYTSDKSTERNVYGGESGELKFK